MFQALLVHLQEALHKQQFVYCMRVMSVGCYQDWSGTGMNQTKHTGGITHVVCVAPPEDEQVVLKTRKR
jgi:hypothetical protein